MTRRRWGLWLVASGSAAMALAIGGPARAADQGQWVYSVRFSPDGGRLICGGAGRMVQVWDVQTGRLLHAFEHPGWQQSVAFSPDGRFGLSGVRGWRMRLWDLQAGKQVHELNPGGAVHCTLFMPDGKNCMSIGGGFDKGHAGICLWEVETGKLLRNFALPDDREDWGQSHGWGALSDDGQILVTSSGKVAIVWDVQTGLVVRTLRGHPGLVWKLDLSGDGQTCITAGLDKSLRVWRVKDGQLLKVIARPTQERGIAFSPDGKLFADGGQDGKIGLWDARTYQRLREIPAHQFCAESVDFSSNGLMLASGGFDATIKVWNVKTGQLLRTLDGQPRPNLPPLPVGPSLKVRPATQPEADRSGGQPDSRH